MAECELCKEMEYSKDYSFVSRLCRGCLETNLAEWIELFNQKQSQWVGAKDENAKLREAMKEAAEDIADWGGYAMEYLQDKHDLKGNVEKYLKLSETGNSNG